MSTFEPEIYTEEYITYIFRWLANGDACVKCSSLNGQTFQDQDLFQDRLYSPIWGDILDLNTGLLLTHPHCRCACEVQAIVNTKQIDELSDFQQFLEIIH